MSCWASGHKMWLLVDIHFERHKMGLKVVQVDDWGCCNILVEGMGHMLWGKWWWAGNYSALEESCTLLRNIPAHAERGENTDGESEQVCALFRDQRVSQVIKPKGSPWKAVEKEPGDRERWKPERLDFILRTLKYCGEWQSGQRA